MPVVQSLKSGTLAHVVSTGTQLQDYTAASQGYSRLPTEGELTTSYDMALGNLAACISSSVLEYEIDINVSFNSHFPASLTTGWEAVLAASCAAINAREGEVIGEERRTIRFSSTGGVCVNELVLWNETKDYTIRALTTYLDGADNRISATFAVGVTTYRYNSVLGQGEIYEQFLGANGYLARSSSWVGHPRRELCGGMR